ncbi:MAG: HEPN domain-containing protein [Deltaproteobacteria bacterium]|nr:HEPN domain-containing protein [Deltaproteobacteria bacterium]
MSEDPRKILALYRLSKAKERLHSSESLLAAGDYADSIGRSYYAVFTSARAVLAIQGVDSKRHSGVIALFNEHYIKTGLLSKDVYRIISGAKAKRERAEYEDYVEFSRFEAEDQLVKAKEFVRHIEDALCGLSG